jgi:hypothetical protein
MNWDVERREPYTVVGIRRLACIRCGGAAEEQWQICADRNRFRPICLPCDVALNRLVLEFMRHPNVEDVMQRYTKEKLV